MNSENHVRVTADRVNNVLRIFYIGEITSSDMPYYLDEIAKALAQLGAGFSLLTDLTKLSSMELACVPFIENAMKLFNERGIALVVRVVPDQTKDIGLNILSLFHYPQELKILTVQTLEEAEQLLG